jgi:hypothetical protein
VAGRSIPAAASKNVQEPPAAAMDLCLRLKKTLRDVTASPCTDTEEMPGIICGVFYLQERIPKKIRHNSPACDRTFE